MNIRRKHKNIPKQYYKLVAIGNSRGIRIPSHLIDKYNLQDKVLIEEQPGGLIIKAETKLPAKLSWKKTYKAMAKEQEHWEDFDITINDGLGDSF